MKDSGYLDYESSEAYTQRMRTGAELVEWNGLSVQAVLNEVSTIFYNNSATDEASMNKG